MRYVRVLVLALVVMGLVVPRAASAQGGEQVFLPTVLGAASAVDATAAAPLPPDSKAFGKSLEEWQYAYWGWLLPSDDFDALQAGTKVGKVYLMPILGPYPNDDPKVVEVSPGTAFMLPMYMWFGERYADGSEDSNVGVEDVADAALLLTLDGKPILCANRDDCVSEDDLSRFYTGGDFDPPYVAPLFGGATVIWFEGLGVVLPPMSVGAHELHLIIEDTIDALPGVPIEYDNTWKIVVQP